MKSLKEKTEIMQACLDAEDIQLRSYENKTWQDCIVEPDFDWFNYDYRVKPKQKEVWITKNINCGSFGNIYETKEAAEKNLNPDWKAVKFIEIIE